METVTGFLVQQPFLALFLVIAAGYVIGAVNIKGFSLGVGAVLFSGLFIGAIAPKAQPPAMVGTLGLVMFLYGLGVQFGKQFFAGLAGQAGRRYNMLAALALAAASAVAVVELIVMDVSHPMMAGLFAGAGTNAATMQAALEAAGTSEPAVGCSVAFPFGLVGAILCMYFVQLVVKPNIDAVREIGTGHQRGRDPLVGGRGATARRRADPAARRRAGAGRAVRRGESAPGARAGAGHGRCPAPREHRPCRSRGCAADAGRARRGPRGRRPQRDRLRARVRVTTPGRWHPGIRSEAAGWRRGHDHARAARRHGDAGDTRPDTGGRRPRRPAHAPQRVQGGAGPLRQLDPGNDRVSYVSLGIGMVLGVLLGTMPIPVSVLGGLKVGIAGGALIVALFLGKLGRTGPLTWTMPLSANLTLRNFGLPLFLAQVAMSSGGPFVRVVSESGVIDLAAGAASSSPWR